MVKIMVVFFLVLMVCAAIAQEGGDMFVSGDAGKWTTYMCEEIGKGSPCDRRNKCCGNLKCFIDGKCGKLIKHFAKDGSEIEVAPTVGEWAYYDGCDSDKGRLQEKCTKDSDCCEPFLCRSNKCSDTAGVLDNFAYLRGF